MTPTLKTIIFPVSDLAKAKTLFSTLVDAEPSADTPYYVGFDVAGVHVGLNPQGHSQGMTGPTGYWHVEDIEKALDRLLEAGGRAQQPVTAVGGGRLIATVTDADGNAIGLIQDTAGE